MTVVASSPATSSHATTVPGDQRGRILDAALRLMAVGGVHAMSMRRLADACGLNVATLYHYFPSKADLLREVVARQSYGELLAQTPPVHRQSPPRGRLAELLQWIWQEMATQDDMWRLLLGEGLRGEPDVVGFAAELSMTFERALVRWLDDLFDVGELADAELTARVLRGLIYGFFIESLPLALGDRRQIWARRADDTAALLLSD